MSAYAEEYGLDLDAAKHEILLIDSARNVQDALSSMYPEEFAGLWIDHSRGFAVNAAMTTDRRSEIEAISANFGLFSVATHVYALSLRNLEDLAGEVREHVDQPYNLDIDIRNNSVDLQVLAKDAATVSADLVAMVSRMPKATVVAADGGASIRVSQAPYLGAPATNILGGIKITEYANGNGEFCTTGFTVQKNGTTTTGILTAGHCTQPLYHPSGVELPWYQELYDGNYDTQWHTTPGYTDVNKIFVSFSGTTRTITSVRAWSGIVVGETVCKFGITTGYDCGVVESKTYEPSWVPHSNPVFVLVNKCGTDISSGGDSGGPVFYQQRAYGITSGSTWGGIGCWEDKLVFNSQTHAAGGLGVTILTS